MAVQQRVSCCGGPKAEEGCGAVLRQEEEGLRNTRTTVIPDVIGQRVRPDTTSYKLRGSRPNF